MRILSSAAIKILRNNWAEGKIPWHELSNEIRTELKYFRIINAKTNGFYRINRDKYNDLVKGKQLKLIADLEV